MPYLMPGASEFLDLAKTPTGKKLHFFDPAKVKSTKPYVESAHVEFSRAVGKLEGLFHDRTGNDVMKHAAAKQLATHLTGRLKHLRDTIVKDKTRMIEAAHENASETLSRRSHNGFYDVTIINWIKGQSQSAEGMARLKKGFERDFDVAGVIFNAKPFVLGLAREVHSSMCLQAVKKHDPASYEKLEEGVYIDEALPRYDKAVSKIHGSFYAEPMAAQADSRVDIEGE